MKLSQNDLYTVIRTVLANVARCYDREQASLVQLGSTAQTEGQIRAAAGELIESVLQNIFSSINSVIPQARIVSKVGSTDYLSKEIVYRGQTFSFDTIQVDRHVWSNGHRIAFVENKTYLDSCYYDRALADFRKIAQSLAQHGTDPASASYIVFAGQNAADNHTLKTYTADFWNDTKHLTAAPDGLNPYTFFFLKGKRSSARPLYKIKPELDESTIEQFVRLIISII